MTIHRRKHVAPPCHRCGDEGAEFCWLCHYFLCDDCLEFDYQFHREEAIAHGGHQR